MYAQVQTCSLYGIEAETVLAEADLAQGLPGFFLVGLADQAVKEARERIRAAMSNQGYPFPPRRITVNLSPAGKKKEGTHFDLPIAVGVLAALGRIPKSKLAEYAFFGELSLSGEVKRVSGLLPLLIGMRESGIRRIVLPRANLAEAMLLPDLFFYPIESLREIVEHLDGSKVRKGQRGLGEASGQATVRGEAFVPWEPETIGEDFSDVKGQEAVKRAVTVAAAGGHGFLLVGPPGVGKTMICRRLPGILPPLNYEEELEVTKIYSAAGKLTEKNPIIRTRPFRAPHYSISAAALCGGGNRPKPGEISLAHRGVLFLDELPEFKRPVLELLRTPLEEGQVTVSRAGGNVTFPARFMLAAAMNPCRCGYSGDDFHKCTCTEAQKRAYLARLSGPVLDRIDLHVGMEKDAYDGSDGEEIFGQKESGAAEKKGTSSAEMRRQVAAARLLQCERYRKENIKCNFELTSGLIEKYCSMTDEAKRLYGNACRYYNLSRRGSHKVLRVARTIADLSGEERMSQAHLAEALQYRFLDKLHRNSER